MARWNRSGLWTHELEPALFFPRGRWIAARKGSQPGSICGDGETELAAIVNLHDRERALGEMAMAEKVCIWLAWHLPRQLVFWCAVRVMTSTQGNPGAWTCGEAAGAWLNQGRAQVQN